MPSTPEHATISDCCAHSIGLAANHLNGTSFSEQKPYSLDGIMQTLQRMLADGVLKALEAREHVLVAPGGGEALLDEVESIIAPTLASITPHLTPTQQVLGEVTSTFGDDAADEAVEVLVDSIAEQLMESDHVDDIFAEDRLIRRDAFRAIRELLRLYVEGDLDVADDAAGDSCNINLDELGYVVSTVAQLADEGLLRSALDSASAAAGVTLCSLDVRQRQAVFEVPDDDDADSRLVIEEAITEEIVDLVDSDLVELPSVEQILQLSGGIATHPGFEDALVAAARDAQQHTNCAAACTVVDRQTLLATLTPLSEDDARSSDTHFAYFIEALERALAGLSAGDESTPRRSPTRRADEAEAKGNSGRRKTKAKRPASKKPPPRQAGKKAKTKAKTTKQAHEPAPAAERSGTKVRKPRRASKRAGRRSSSS